MAAIRQGQVVEHVLVFSLYFFTQYYDYLYIDDFFKQPGSVRATFGGRWKFMTYQNYMAHTVFFSSCVLADFIEGVLGKKAAGLRKVQDYVLVSILFPMSMIVMVVFWGIYAVDRELIFPASLDHVIPPWINHVWHTTIVPVLLLEMYMVHHKYPSRRAGLTGAITLGLVYLTWILIVAKVGGFWVYPFMAVMTGFQFVLFCCFTAAIGCVFYLMGELCNNVFWGPRETPRKQKKRA
ncbi:PREDICTED: androgen-induced gene 1 protein-like isoform X2 [Branchiostoma belcheri]|uniref:Androgen-induced gene 1 protein-like isoform X2 n=1 Tax=Branchiostoma belcheri TaxID=7741 RepID=A0A6P4ZBR8_BRABE|nr:PREDICTED: androgen-induced gene 1 protein-like isoform X2 [Branchiostoma belcheri]